MFGKLLILLTAPLFAADAIHVTNTETIPFADPGTLRFEKTVGTIHLQAWDRPEIDIVLSKSTYDPQARARLDRIQIKAGRRGNDAVVSAVFSPRGLLDNMAGRRDVQVEYDVHAPRNLALAIEHTSGDVYLTAMEGNIQAHVRDGQITLRLPENGQYSIAAKCEMGQVYSDFPGTEKFTMWFGENFLTEGGRARKLDLKTGLGDILILKTPYQPPASTQLRH